ncbi:hypothetical protein COBT_001970 [Conglomerata obtusa]
MFNMHAFSTKTKYKILIVIFTSFCFVILLFLSIKINNKNEYNEESTALVSLFRPNFTDFTLHTRIYLKHFKHGKQIKINHRNYDLDKSKIIDLKLPLNLSKKYYIFKDYNFDLKIIYNSLELIHDNIQFVNYMESFIIKHDELLDTYYLSCNNKTKFAFVFIWIFVIMLSLANFGFVSEIWIRNKSGSILQVILNVLIFNTIFNIQKYSSEVNSDVDFTNLMIYWCLFVNGMSLLLLLTIFIFRYMNNKYYCGVRNVKVQNEQNRYEIYAI